MTESWWQQVVVYQVYPRSFCDTTGNGIGDLEGLRAHLDHLVWLGVDAVWLSPIFRSPMADFGYDVSAYDEIDPLFGTLADFDRLVAEAHAAGLRVLLDWVPNHTSIEHPWFAEHPDFYVWVDGQPDQPPNGWIEAFGDGPAWKWDDRRGQWYLHLFLPEQADLDWSNPAVVEAMHATLRFWLDRGVDGFRMDVVHCIGKGHDLPELLPEQEAGPVVAIDVPRTHTLLQGIRPLLDEYGATSVGEVYLLDTAKVATYYGTPEAPELHLSFNFPGLWAPWEAAVWRTRVDEVERHLIGDRWPTWVLSNHDVPRHRTRYGSEARARAAAVLLTTLRGTPFLYAGEELGLEDAVVPPDRVVDPGGRDGCRAPFPWTEADDHGWAGGADAWLPWPPHAGARSVEAQRADQGSTLWLYKRLLAARRASPALRSGAFAWLASPPDVLAYERRLGDDRRVVLVNQGDATAVVELDGAWEVELASDGTSEPGALAGDAALVLRPA
ncbi:MAG: alpha-amylase family glycosyl hydrolase [Acidimicrobiales bacterium]